MRTEAQEAGPGRDRDHPVEAEAAGPASPQPAAEGGHQRLMGSERMRFPAAPRLAIEEVRFCLRCDSVEARVTLAAGGQRFTGTTNGGGKTQPIWQLAAATVTAIQQYLQHCAVPGPASHIQLVDAATATTGVGHEVIHVTVRLTRDSNQTHLLGSALVRNDRCSTAVAAALDATSRWLGSFRSPAVVPLDETEQASPSRQAPAGDPEAEVESPQVVEIPAPRLAPARTRPSASTLTLGVEIGPGSVRAAVVDERGRILAEQRRPADAAAGPEATLRLGMEAARAARASPHCAPERVAAMGLAAPGRLRAGDGVCVSWGELPTWREVQLAAPCSQALDLPVSLIGVTQAAGLGEVRFGAAQDLASVILARVGREIEVAVICEGRPLALGEGNPGQAGHMVVAPGGPRCTCGESGCWQALAGHEALVMRVLRDLSSGLPSGIPAAVDNHLAAITPAVICRLAAGGDAVARAAVEETGRFLALGLANLIALFDPEAIILDGAPGAVGSALRHAAETALKASPRAHILSRCVLLSPGLGETAPVVGAAAWAAQQVG